MAYGSVQSSVVLKSIQSLENTAGLNNPSFQREVKFMDGRVSQYLEVDYFMKLNSSKLTRNV
jgi:hypothetical protein